MENSDQTIHLS